MIWRSRLLFSQKRVFRSLNRFSEFVYIELSSRNCSSEIPRSLSDWRLCDKLLYCTVASRTQTDKRTRTEIQRERERETHGDRDTCDVGGRLMMDGISRTHRVVCKHCRDLIDLSQSVGDWLVHRPAGQTSTLSSRFVYQSLRVCLSVSVCVCVQRHGASDLCSASVNVDSLFGPHTTTMLLSIRR